jgi:hypothetical protein
MDRWRAVEFGFLGVSGWISMMDEETRNRIDDLQRRLEETQSALEAVRALTEGRINNPYPTVFPAVLDGTATWHERAIVDGDWVDFTDGRYETDEEGEAAIIEPGDEVILLAVRDGNMFRYVPIRSISLPMYRVMSITSPTTLGGGKYWLRLQQRKEDTSYAADSSTFSFTALWEDANTDPVLGINSLFESNVHTIALTQFVRCLPTGEMAGDYPVVEIIAPFASLAC